MANDSLAVAAVSRTTLMEALANIRVENAARIMQQRPHGLSGPRSRTKNPTSNTGWNGTSYYARNKVADQSLTVRSMTTSEWLGALQLEVTSLFLTCYDNGRFAYKRDDPEAAQKYSVPTLKGRTLH
jgi:hypothetical protein